MSLACPPTSSAPEQVIPLFRKQSVKINNLSLIRETRNVCFFFLTRNTMRRRINFQCHSTTLNFLWDTFRAKHHKSRWCISLSLSFSANMIKDSLEYQLEFCVLLAPCEARQGSPDLHLIPRLHYTIALPGRTGPHGTTDPCYCGDSHFSLFFNKASSL